MLERTCLACGRKTAKRELLRLSRTPEGVFVIDARQKLPGRGAYVCPTRACAELLQRKKGLHHGFRQQVPPEIYQRILDFVQETTMIGDNSAD
ncbi:YlxR family protein [candidate division KSB1 bacterium]|nr:YlxR family protein [candidate division KSB1 bacterium]